MIQIGPRLNEQVAIDIALEISAHDPTAKLSIDFSKTKHFEPFGMLFVASAVRQAVRRAAEAGGSVEILPHGIEPDGIAAHMGFWRSMGLQIGRDVNSSAAKDSYIAISRMDVGELLRNTGNVLPLAISNIETLADRLAKVLTPDSQKPLYDALRYSLREILRNGVEHAQSPAIWYAGMSWPERGFVQIAVLDEGRGIHQSLTTNTLYNLANDIQAIDAALLPGVSRNIGKKISRRQLEEWAEARLDMPPEFYQNSGYGLYVVSEIARAGGQFMLCSGKSARQFNGAASIEKQSTLAGTALRIVLYPNKVGEVVEDVFRRIRSVQSGTSGRPLITASMMRRLKVQAEDPDGDPPDSTAEEGVPPTNFLDLR